MYVRLKRCGGMYTKTKYEEDTTRIVLNSLSLLADLLSKTMGPKGRNVLLSDKKSKYPVLSNDGYVIVNNLSMNDKYQNTILKIIRASINQINELAGDGTTLTAVLIYEMYSESIKQIVSGANPKLLEQGLNEAYEKISSYVKEHTCIISSREYIEKLAVNTAKDETIGKMIAEAFECIGPNGLISIRESQNAKNEVTYCTGSRIENGYSSIKLRYDREINRIKCKNIAVLISEAAISDENMILPFLEYMNKISRPLLVIAPDITDKALELINHNIEQGIVKVMGIKAHGVGTYQYDYLHDLAAITGVHNTLTEFSLDAGFKENSIENYLGFAKEVIITANETVIINDGKNAVEVQKRIQTVEKRITEQTVSAYDKQKLYQRISVLDGKMAVLHLASYSQLRLDEKITHVIDAIDSARSGLREGIVPGGGLIFLRASQDMKEWVDSLQGDKALGAKILQRALKKPVYYVIQNSGYKPEIIMEELINKDFQTGFEVIDGKYCDFYIEGIVDSALTASSVLSVAHSTILSLMKVSTLLVAIKLDKEDYEIKKSGFNMIPDL